MVTKLMGQLAATQEVNHAQQLIDVVNNKASTQGDLIRAACGCTKEELLRVFTEITGRQFAEYVDPALGGCEYESLDVEIALHLDTMRGHKEFLVKPFEEKYELVMNAKGHDECLDLLNLFSTDEVYAMADKLGINRTGAELWMNTVNRVRFLVQEKLDRLEQSTDVKDTVSVEASEPVQVEVIDTPAVKAPKMQKGRKTMTKATVKELRATAKAYGLKGYSKLNKAQLEELIRKHDSTAQETAQEQQEVVSVITPDYDAAFDETAYSPDVQEVSVIVDDIPTDHEPDTQEEKTVQPAKFIIGRHYQSRGLDKGIVTFLGKVSRDCGYFVDSLNCYHRVKIISDSTGEYASISHKSRAFPADRISADHEVSEHEIISVANGTSIVLNAENVIHSYEELEAKLAPKPAPVQELKPVIASESDNPKAQPGQTSKIQVIISPKKNPYKARRRHHKPSWLKPVQFASKPRKYSSNSKLLMKPIKAASTIRIRKF